MCGGGVAGGVKGRACMRDEIGLPKKSIETKQYGAFQYLAKHIQGVTQATHSLQYIWCYRETLIRHVSHVYIQGAENKAQFKRTQAWR